MFRKILLPVLFVLAFATPGNALEARLHPFVTVEGATVRLSDLFQNAGKYGDKVIAYAPQPGRKLVLDAKWLYRAARIYGIAWRPNSNLDQSIVSRRSVTIDTAIIEEAILGTAAEKITGDGKLEAELDNKALQIHLPADFPNTVSVRTFSHDPVSGRFTALVFAPDMRPGATRMTVTGRVRRLVEVPVLSSRKSGSDVIRESDIEWVTLRDDQVGRNVILDPGRLIGMSPKRPIQAQRPIRLAEVQTPVLVEKGSRVTITLNAPYLKLTATGRALEDGGKGETIRVQNTQSSKTIDAVVVATGHVSVESGSTIASR